MSSVEHMGLVFLVYLLWSLVYRKLPKMLHVILGTKIYPFEQRLGIIPALPASQNKRGTGVSVLKILLFPQN